MILCHAFYDRQNADKCFLVQMLLLKYMYNIATYTISRDALKYKKIQKKGFPTH